jgi:hypothetical protein
MRGVLRRLALAGAVLAGTLGIASSSAHAQGFGYGGYGWGYPQTSVGGYGGGYGGGFAAPDYNYYGNGGHDYQPHWHTTQTPFGSFAWYGNGVHDFLPHEHSHSACGGGYQGYSPSPFGGVTTSYYPSTPYIFMPW